MQPSADMVNSTRLIVVSNRLPVELVREGKEWKGKRSAGGLATAMDPILKRAGGVWIGWSGAKGEEPREALELLRQEQSCIAVELPADILEKYYEGYANQALWPLFHNFTSMLHFERHGNLTSSKKRRGWRSARRTGAARYYVARRRGMSGPECRARAQDELRDNAT